MHSSASIGGGEWRKRTVSLGLSVKKKSLTDMGLQVRYYDIHSPKNLQKQQQKILKVFRIYHSFKNEFLEKFLDKFSEI